MGLRDYARVARTYWKHIAVVTLIVTLLATAWSTFRPRIYAAEASAVVIAVGTDNVSSLLAGDTLFRGGIGRTDLWGGDFDAIEQSIKERLYTLDGHTLVVTGHGADTEIGQERETNSFVRAY